MSGGSLFGAVWELSWLDYVAVIILGFVIYRKILRPLLFGRKDTSQAEVELPPLKKQDMTLEQLRQYNGKSNDTDGRICIAVDGKIFDVTRGKRNYGPDGPYGIFAGRDASRGLATMDLSEKAVSDEYDTLEGLDATEMESMQEWASTFSMRYPYVGKLLKPDEEPTKYGEEEVASFQL